MCSFLSGQRLRYDVRGCLFVLIYESYNVLIYYMEQIPGATDLGLMPRKITKVAILGGGLMGSGIATAMILSNYPVVLKEVNEKFLNAGIDRIKGGTWFSIILNPAYCFENILIFQSVQ